MKYTLIAFQCSPSDLKVPVPQPGAGDLTPLGKALEHSTEHRADICEGIYVFETVPGYSGILHLLSCLKTLDISFAELPFEGGLLGLFSNDVSDKLKSIGIESCVTSK